MKCPYCQAQIENGEDFCKECGQSLTASKNVTNVSDIYWSKVREEQRKRGDHYTQLQKNERENNNRTKMVRLTILAIVVVATAVLAMLIGSVNKTNQEKLKIAASSIKGMTFSDVKDVAPPTIFGSYHPEILTLKFNSDGTVDYKYSIGDYTHGTSYEIVSVKEHEKCSYEMTIDFFGNLKVLVYRSSGTLIISEVETWDDGRLYNLEIFG